LATLTLDQARPGMMLAAEVFDRRGRLLMRPDTELTEKHLESLRMWGVTHVDVDVADDEPELVEQLDPEVVAEVEAELDELFANAGPPHPFLDGLREAARAAALHKAGARPAAVGVS